MAKGVEEEAAGFDLVSAAFVGAERFRRFGSAGPLYEVVGQSGNRLSIVVVESGETLDYPLAASLRDPAD